MVLHESLHHSQTPSPHFMDNQTNRHSLSRSVLWRWFDRMLSQSSHCERVTRPRAAAECVLGLLLPDWEQEKLGTRIPEWPPITWHRLTIPIMGGWGSGQSLWHLCANVTPSRPEADCGSGVLSLLWHWQLILVTVFQFSLSVIKLWVLTRLKRTPCFYFLHITFTGSPDSAYLLRFLFSGPGRVPDWPGLVSTGGPLTAPSLLLSNWSRQITWPEDWPVIGPLWLRPGKQSRDQGNFDTHRPVCDDVTWTLAWDCQDKSRDQSTSLWLVSSN